MISDLFIQDLSYARRTGIRILFHSQCFNKNLQNHNTANAYLLFVLDLQTFRYAEPYTISML